MEREELKEELGMLGAGAIRKEGGPIDRILETFDELRSNLDVHEKALENLCRMVSFECPIIVAVKKGMGLYGP